MRIRNWRFDAGKAPIHHVSVPVVSVGNMTVGGTGKTPTVAWLAQWYRQRGVRVAIVSRGYGASGGERNDEALELEQSLPDVPHLQNPDRVVAARTAIDELGSQLIIMDDGFQHRRLARDLDIVLIDACEPFGFGHVFPRGLLREPLSGLRRADIILVTRSDMATGEQLAAIRAKTSTLAPAAIHLEMVHAPYQLRSATGQIRSLDWLSGRRVAAFCGIGNPAGFRHTLGECGCELEAIRSFPDHHAYSASDIASLKQWLLGHPAAGVVVCSHKDLVKICVERLGETPLWAVEVRMQPANGADELTAPLAAMIVPDSSAGPAT